MLNPTDAEKKFLGQFKNTDLNRLLVSAKEELYTRTVYMNKEQDTDIYKGAARFCDLLLAYIEGELK